jgi:hypothetical protein
MATTDGALRELTRPWKILTLAAGIGLLIAGSIYTPAPDWDIPISIIMALVAYLTAPWAMRVFITRDWARWPLAIFATWFGVDGCYAIYWYFVDPQALELMREANAPASLSMYLAVGLFWMPRAAWARASWVKQ